MRLFQKATDRVFGKRQRVSRGLAGAGALLCSLVLSGYVAPPAKVFEQWVRLGPSAGARGPHEIPVRWGEKEGRLYAGGVGRSALSIPGERTAFDAGPGTRDPMASLWLAVHLFWGPSVEDLVASLEQAGVDFRRGGYARTDRSSDGVAHTLGARGEGEVDIPQVWFTREPLWPIRVSLPGARDVVIGPPDPQGWPAWFLVGGDALVEIVGLPYAAPNPPPWARPAGGSFPSNSSDPTGAWRPILGDPAR